MLRDGRGNRRSHYASRATLACRQVDGAGGELSLPGLRLNVCLTCSPTQHLISQHARTWTAADARRRVTPVVMVRALSSSRPACLRCRGHPMGARMSRDKAKGCRALHELRQQRRNKPASRLARQPHRLPAVSGRHRPAVIICRKIETSDSGTDNFVEPRSQSPEKG